MTYWLLLTFVILEWLGHYGVFNYARPIAERRDKLITNGVMWVFWWLFWQADILPGWFTGCWALIVGAFTLNRVLRPRAATYEEAMHAMFDSLEASL